MKNYLKQSKVNFTVILLLVMTMTMSFYPVTQPTNIQVQDDPIEAPECTTPPTIDGVMDDDCWNDAEWQEIDQVWIEYGEILEANDFTGRFKVTWSSETDKLYFVFEIVDDALVKGYAFPDGGWPNWDVVELFIDEDNSGGDHTHDNNAFAYHITAGNNSKDYEIIDLQDGWDPVDFSHHAQVAIASDNNTYIWEIALTVYNDQYDMNNTDNPTEELEVGKTMGLSAAYCDNDGLTEEPKTRDNFIGSVEVAQAAYNDHWKNASEFGTLKLVEGSPATSLTNTDKTFSDGIRCYPNPIKGSCYININSEHLGKHTLKCYDLTGKTIFTQVFQKPQPKHLLKIHPDWNNGIYFISIQHNDKKWKQKVVVKKQ